MQAAGKKVTIQAIIIAIGTLTSRISGLIRDMIMAAYFPRMVTDAWLVGFRLPNLFRRLFGEGALGVSFIPVFIHTQRHEGEKEANELVKSLFTVLFFVLSMITILGIIFSREILLLLVPGESYLQVPGKFELTLQMTQIMFGFIFCICFYAYFMSILNTVDKFFIGAVAPVLLNLSLIFCTLVPYKLTGNSLWIAWAVLIGGFLQAVILIGPVLKNNYQLKFTAKLKTKELKQIFKSMLPAWLGMGVVQFMTIINTRFASDLEQGSISWIYWADRLLELPLSLFSVSLGTALLPTLSRFWTNNEKDLFFETSNQQLRLVFFLSFPAAVGLYFLAGPIVETLFLRGQFNEYDLKMTTEVLQIYTLGVLSYSGVRVLVSPFYAVKNTFVPAFISVICLIFHVLLCQIFISMMGLKGLALSTMLSATLNFILLLILHKKLLGPLHFRKFLYSITKFLIASIFMALGTFIFKPLDQLLNFIPFHNWIVLFLTLSLCISIYFLVCHILNVDEMTPVTEKLKSKFRKYFPVKD